jgi:hypothetical protein
MLENSLWYKYSPERSIAEVLATFYKIDVEQIGGDESVLYAILKRHLTKKEFRLFIMKEAGVDDEAIMSEMHLKTDDFQGNQRKAYRKLKQDKLRNLILNSGVSESDTQAESDAESDNI